MSALKPPLGAAISLVLSVASSAWAQETATTVREAPSVTVTDTAQADWREEYAYTLGLQAYIYAFPLTYMTQLRHDWITNPNSDFYAALNQFHHKQILSNHVNFTSGGTPNQDTLYSFAWIDLRDGPVVLSHPDMSDRYFSFEIADYFSDNFAYVGKRTTGSTAGAFAIVPPGWQGTLPDDVKEAFESRTTFALLFGRTLVENEADVAEVNALQEQYGLTPLAYWGEAEQAPEKRDVFAPYPEGEDGLGPWRTINRAWSENPLPGDQDSSLVQLFAEIGIGPSFSAENLDDLPEPKRRGLARAARAGRQMVEDIMTTGAYKSTVVNGWSYPPETFGRAGVTGDYVTRSAQSLGGILANDPEEAVYLNTFNDPQGNPLQGGRRYTITFDEDNMPPTNEFFSVTLYGPDTNFVPNDIKRYSIGDRTPGLTLNPDGGFTIYIQPDEPADPERRANWLPSPQDGTFYLVLRTYGPREPIIEQTWAPPHVVPSP